MAFDPGSFSSAAFSPNSWLGLLAAGINWLKQTFVTAFTRTAYVVHEVPESRVVSWLRFTFIAAFASESRVRREVAESRVLVSPALTLVATPVGETRVRREVAATNVSNTELGILDE